MKKPYDDDLFKDSVMTFGEHLEELRRCLMKAVFGLAAGMIVGFFLANWVVDVIQSPLEVALQDFYLGRAEDELRKIIPDASDEELALVTQRQMIFDRVYVEPYAVLDALKRAYPQQTRGLKLPAATIEPNDLRDVMQLGSALVEGQGAAGWIGSQLSESEQSSIRSLVAEKNASPENVAALAGALNRLLNDRDLFTPELVADLKVGELTVKEFQRIAELTEGELQLLNRRLISASFPGSIAARQPVVEEILLWKPVANDPRTRTKALGMPEPFMIWLKAAFITGLVISSPWVFFQIWTFVAAGLYPHEKKYVRVFMPISVILFLVGAAVAFFFVFEPVLGFFLNFNRSLKIDSEPRITEWLNFFMFLPIGFGIAFQLPLVMLFLERIHVMSVQSYLKQWRVAVLVIWVLAALLTPADPTSIFFLAVPLMFLYFGGVLLCKWWPSK